MRDSRRPSVTLDRGGRRLAVPLAFWLLLQLPASAADIPVTGGCTLVDAIKAANTNSPSGGCPTGDAGADSVILTGDVTLSAAYDSTSSGLPEVTSPITVEGNDFTIARDSSAAFRIFSVGATGALILENTTVSGGGGPDFEYDWGGGIYVYQGSVFLDESTVTGGSASLGGGIFALHGTVSLTSSTVSGNHALKTGGGIYSEFGQLSLINSTVSGNTADYGYGGGVADFDASVSIVNSTLSGNSGAISHDLGGSAILSNSLLANSTGEISNCSGAVVNLGNNLSDDDSCGTIPSNLSGLDSALADNGGSTLTHALLPGSNAIDNAGTCGLVEDQRGVPRDDGDCDSGSFEFVESGCTLLELEGTITADENYECVEIHLGPNLTVMGPGGNLKLTAESQVVFFNEVAVTVDGRLEVEISSSP